MSSNDIIKSVSKKLKYYFEVKRLEDGFDLSGPDCPRLDHPPLKARPTLMYDGLHDRPLKHYFSPHQARAVLTQFKPPEGSDAREKEVQRRVKRYMRHHTFITPVLDERLYRKTKRGRTLRNEMQGGFSVPLKKTKSAHRGGYPVLRSVPSQYLSRSEAKRLVNVATKLLVATETVDLKGTESADSDGETGQVGDGRRSHPRSAPRDGRSILGERRSSQPDRKNAPPGGKSSQPERRSAPPGGRSRDRDGRSTGEEGRTSEEERRSTHEETRSARGNESKQRPAKKNKDPRPKTSRGPRSEKNDGEERGPNIYTYDPSGKRILLKALLEEDEDRSKPHSDRDGGFSRDNTPSPQPDNTDHQDGRPDDNDSVKPWLRKEIGKNREENDRRASPTNQPHPPSEDRPLVVRPGSARKRGTEKTSRQTGWNSGSSSSLSSDDVAVVTGAELLDEQDASGGVVDEGEYVEYRVRVVTGHRQGSSTQAEVHLVLVGDKGRSPRISLDQSKTHKVKFQKGQEDVFDIACCDVGPLRTLGIGHGSKQTKDGWFLAKVSVTSRKHNLEYVAPCETWLSAVEGATFKEFSVKSCSSYEGDWDDVPSFQDHSDLHIRPVSSVQGHRSSPPSDQRVVPSPGPQFPEDKEKEAESSQRLMTLQESKSTGDPSQNPSTPRVQRRDDFFDQQVRDKDYSSVIETLSSTTDQDNRDDFSKPEDNQQRDRNFRYDMSVDRNDYEKTTGPTLRVEEQGRQDEVRGLREEADEGRAERGADRGDHFMDGFKAGLEAAEKSQEVSVATSARSSGDEEEQAWRRGPTVHEAAETGDLEQMKKLAQVSPQSKLQLNDKGWQPLHIAAAAGQLEVVQWLTVNVVDLDVMTPTGYTPMHVAAANGHTNCMMVLAAMGAKIDVSSVDNMTPLHLAASSGRLESCKWLVANRADITTRDMSGRRALDAARDNRQVAVEQLLTSCEHDQTMPGSSLAQIRSRTPSLTPSQGRASTKSELYGVPEEDERPWTDDRPPTSKPTSDKPPPRHESGTEDSSQDSSDSETDSQSYTSTSRSYTTTSQTTDYSSTMSGAQKKRHDQELMKKREMYKEQQATRKDSSFLEDIRRELNSGTVGD